MRYAVICAWCGKPLGFKEDGEPPDKDSHITHGICQECKQKALAELKTKKQEGE